MSAYGPLKQSQETPNAHSNIGFEPEQDEQFIEKSYQRQKIVMSDKKQKLKKARKGYSIKRVDKLLFFAALVSILCAFMMQLYVKGLMNDYKVKEEERARAQQEESLKITTQILTKYNEKILKLKNRKQNSRKSISKNEKIVRSKLKALQQKNCRQFLKLPSYILTNQMLNPYIQQDNLEKGQRQEQDRNKKQYDKTILELQKQQNKIKWQTTRQQQEVIRINKEYDAMGIPRQSSRPVGGVTAQRLQAAKQLKKLVAIDPWQSSELAEAQFNYYDKHYNISKYQQLPFCIVVPTFNNEQNQRYKHNLNSIVQQNYTNYHVVIMEDASTDQTGSLLDKYVDIIKQQWQKRNKKINIDVYHNKQQQRAMPNLRKAALEYCQAHQIYMIVDGDDQLVGRNVFKLFNSQFQAKKSWFVYSNFMSFVGTIGYSRPFKKQIMQQNRYRQANFVTSHLRAFYTQLFRLIKQQDLKTDNGQYLKAANDVAICLPILQMSHMRISYIAQITYMYNSNTGLNNHLVRLQEQINNSKLIRNKPKYAPLIDLKFQY